MNTEYTNQTFTPTTSYRPTPRTVLLLALALLIVQLLVTLAFYPALPNMLASHWNAQGHVDSIVPKWIYVLIMPAISTGLYTFLALVLRLVLVAAPKIGSRGTRSAAAQRRLGVLILTTLLIGQQALFLLIQFGLLLLALLRAGNPTA